MADLPPSDECHYKVTVTREPVKEEETFDTLEKAKDFAAQRLGDDDIIKCTIKKVEPDENDDNVSDGERVQHVKNKATVSVNGVDVGEILV